MLHQSVETTAVVVPEQCTPLPTIRHMCPCSIKTAGHFGRQTERRAELPDKVTGAVVEPRHMPPEGGKSVLSLPQTSQTSNTFFITPVFTARSPSLSCLIPSVFGQTQTILFKHLFLYRIYFQTNIHLFAVKTPIFCVIYKGVKKQSPPLFLIIFIVIPMV
jgi:hypothetical protein